MHETVRYQSRRYCSTNKSLLYFKAPHVCVSLLQLWPHRVSTCPACGASCVSSGPTCSSTRLTATAKSSPTSASWVTSERTLERPRLPLTELSVGETAVGRTRGAVEMCHLGNSWACSIGSSAPPLVLLNMNSLFLVHCLLFSYFTAQMIS